MLGLPRDVVGGVGNVIRKLLRDVFWWAVERVDRAIGDGSPDVDPLDIDEEPVTFIRTVPTVTPEAAAMVAPPPQAPRAAEQPKPLEGSIEARIEEARRLR